LGRKQLEKQKPLWDGIGLKYGGRWRLSESSKFTNHTQNTISTTRLNVYKLKKTVVLESCTLKTALYELKLANKMTSLKQIDLALKQHTGLQLHRLKREQKPQVLLMLQEPGRLN